MNIVKLKDILMPEGTWIAEFFNKNLKGKYAYWIQMRYIFPLNSLDYKTYIQFEQLDPIHFLGPDMLPHIDLYSDDCCMMDFAREYIDTDATELANNINDYRTANEYVADADIDITKLRRFRTWLANELVMFNTSVDGSPLNHYTANQMHMLEYYKNGMYNEVVKQLNEFGLENAFLTNPTVNGCGCCSNNVSTLYNLGQTGVCNALDIYKKNLHTLMVQTFENVDFWTGFNKDFIGVFKKYVDNIVKTGLVISTNGTKSLFADCKCRDNEANSSSAMLRKLSEALDYIIKDDIKGHSNFIHDALYNWAEYLYDHMSWEI